MSLRKIVVMQPHEWLLEGHVSRSFSPSEDRLSKMLVPGMAFDRSFSPLQVAEHGATKGTQVVPGVRGLTGVAGQGYVLAATFEDEQAAEHFGTENKAEVRGIFADPEIHPFQVATPGGPVGTAADVVQRLNLGPLQAEGLDGRGVKVMIVDTGIDGRSINVSGGFSPNPAVAPGASPRAHGTMVAYDAKLAAPGCMIYDYPLLRASGAGQPVAFLSDAIRVYAEILAMVLQLPGPVVVVNSWGMPDRKSDAPIGNPQNYSANPQHPFNQLVAAVAGSGVDVVFAAGNCGAAWPDASCGIGDRGPGQSIHGANSHPDATSVGAVTVNDEVLGYTAEGPGALAAQKPDLAGFSHFAGSGIAAADIGTSAACPVVAGVIASLRTRPSVAKMSPVQVRAALVRSARRIGAPGWDPQSGAGVVDAGAALALLP